MDTAVEAKNTYRLYFVEQLLLMHASVTCSHSFHFVKSSDAVPLNNYIAAR